MNKDEKESESEKQEEEPTEAEPKPKPEMDEGNALKPRPSKRKASRSPNNMKKEQKLKLKRKRRETQFLNASIKEYNEKFLQRWSETLNFHIWKVEHVPDLGFRSRFDTSIEETLIYYENGSSFRGPLVNGMKNGRGVFHDAMANQTYNGQYYDDMRHGSGTLNSETEAGKSPEYVYDGEWKYDKREGHGQLITKHIKYSGSFKADQYHGYGVYCDQEGRVYCGDWEYGIQHG